MSAARVLGRSSLPLIAAAAPDGRFWSELADRLSQEFAAPVGVLDGEAPVWLAHVGAAASAYPELDAAIRTVRHRGERDRVFLWKAPGEVTWLVMRLRTEGTEAAWVWAGFAHHGAGAPWGPFCPEPALLAWGREVSRRLQSEAHGRATFGERSSRSRVARRSGSLLDELIRRLRVSDPPDRFQLGATRALREELGAAAVAWVPASPREPVIIGGAVPDLTSDDYRRLVPTRPDPPIRFLDTTGPNGLRRMILVADAAETPAGWLVLVDLSDDRLLSASEIETVHSVALLLVAQRANARVFGELKDLLFGIIRALVSAIDAKDPYTAGHSERVARIAVRVGEQLGLSSSQRSDLYLMGLLHDIGKIGIEDSVLKKPGKLTPEEYHQIQAHVKIGVHILSGLKRLHHVLPGVAYHHEFFNGAGYPSGLGGEAIPLPARILAVADTYDAMSSNRPYRRRLSPEQIEMNFRAGSDRQWDAHVIDALFACLTDVEHIRTRGLGESLALAVNDAMDRAQEPSGG